MSSRWQMIISDYINALHREPVIIPKPPQKRCSKCNQFLSHDRFYEKEGRLVGICKTCYIKKQREQRLDGD